MGEEEIAARLVALKSAGASDATIRGFLSSVGRGDPVEPPVAPPVAANPEKPKLGALDRVFGFAEKALQTINPFQDELTGVVQAVGALVPGGRSPKEAFDQERAASLSRNAQFARDAPMLSAAATLAGVVPAVALGGGTRALPAVARGVGAVQRTANALRAGGRSALTGAKAAAPFAFGGAEGDVGDRLKQTLGSTALVAGLTGATGAVLQPILTRNPRGSLAAALRIGGTDVADAAAQRGALDPAVRAATPVLAHAGPVETAIVNRSIRTKAGAATGRQIEQQLNRLDRERHAVGEAKKIRFRTPEVIDDPEALRILAEARTNPAIERVVKAVQKDLAGKKQIVGDVVKEFSGSKGEAIARGVVTEADLIAQSTDPALVSAVFRQPAAKAHLLAQPMPKGFTYTESNPYTLEFFDRFQRTARKVLRKDYKAGGTATTDLVDTVNDALVTRVREVHPAYNALQRPYGQYSTVLEDLESRVRPSFSASAPIGRRYRITAHPGAEEAANTNLARAGADPFSPAGQVSARIGLIRRLTRIVPQRQEREATKQLLRTGDAGTQALLGASQPKRGTLPRGALRVPALGLGVFGDQEPQP